MIAEWGLVALILACCFSLLLGLGGLYAVSYRKMIWLESLDWFVNAQGFFTGLSFLCLIISFLCNDFSVVYVLANSSTQLPWFYKLCAVWGGHEGSMLLWVLILNFWTCAVSWFSRHMNPALRSRILVILGLLSAGFLLFLLMTSNPFIRQFQDIHSSGRDLNPLLQDPGFLFHPPMLYMGYVGFSVAFAFALSALWLGRIETDWAKWTRPWTLAAWCCLTLGITLGSWWAYRELGWGGWWFWDPVENASFMPWLVGTALIHSLAATEKRKQFQSWTLLLAIAAFSLSLIGTFLVRSGVLTSVHAFAVDPLRGFYILSFLALVIGSSLILFSVKTHRLQRPAAPEFVSRESALLLNNIFLAVLMLTVLLGTLYPLIIDGLGLGKLSVGAPYFNAVFVPFSVPFLLLMGIGIHLNWRQDKARRLWSFLSKQLVASAVLSAIFLKLFFGRFDYHGWLGGFLGLWIILNTGQLLFNKFKQKQLSRTVIAMSLAHLGIAATAIGIALSSGYGIQKDVKMAPGQSESLAGYRIDFVQTHALKGSNYHGEQAQFIVSHRDTKHIIYPEKRIYDVSHMAMTDSAIDVTPFRDIYIALGEPLDPHAWSVRLYYKPFIRWIWGGGFLMLAGGFWAMADRRYYLPRRVRKRVSLEVVEA